MADSQDGPEPAAPTPPKRRKKATTRRIPLPLEVWDEIVLEKRKKLYPGSDVAFIQHCIRRFGKDEGWLK